MKKLLVATSFLTAICAAHAGRPLSVDDANVNEKGAGHVEMYYENSGNTKQWTVAPAFAVADGLELALSYSRDTPNTGSASGIQAKYQFSKPKEGGCNAAGALALGRSSPDSSIGATLMATCQLGFADLHANLGATRDKLSKTTVKTVGLALEKELGGVGLHIEIVGEEGAKPKVQIGARKELVKNWQLDGTIGRQAGQSLWSLGMKYQF
jgi:hypothetical protein